MSIRERHSLKQTVKLLSLWCWKRVRAHGQTRAAYPRLEPRDAECAARLKKRTLTNLYNERPAWLDLAHKKLDVAVIAAYGWGRAGEAEAELSDEQILENLLALNLERAAAEAKAARQLPTKRRTSRAKSEE